MWGSSIPTLSTATSVLPFLLLSLAYFSLAASGIRGLHRRHCGWQSDTSEQLCVPCECETPECSDCNSWRIRIDGGICHVNPPGIVNGYFPRIRRYMASEDPSIVNGHYPRIRRHCRCAVCGDRRREADGLRLLGAACYMQQNMSAIAPSQSYISARVYAGVGTEKQADGVRRTPRTKNMGTITAKALCPRIRRCRHGEAGGWRSTNAITVIDFRPRIRRYRRSRRMAFDERGAQKTWAGTQYTHSSRVYAGVGTEKQTDGVRRTPSDSEILTGVYAGAGEEKQTHGARRMPSQSYIPARIYAGIGQANGWRSTSAGHREHGREHGTQILPAYTQV